MKGLTRLALIAVAAVGMGLVASAPSWAIHRGAGGLVCGGCHTMHNSQGRRSLDVLGTGTGTVSPSDVGTGGSLILLRANVSRRADIHNLCLQCHAQNGSQGSGTHQPHGQTAPKVLLGTAWDGTDYKQIGAGGDFSAGCTGGGSSWDCSSATAPDNAGGTANSNVSTGKIHSIGATSVIPPGASTTTAITDFSCTNCHDPHGVTTTTAAYTSNTEVNLYRMLRKKPVGGLGAMDRESSGVTVKASSYIGGVAGAWNGLTGTGNNYIPGSAISGEGIWPIVKADMTGIPGTDAVNSNWYGNDSTTGYEATIGAWCAQCHDNWHETKNTGNNTAGLDWKRHPVNNLINDTGSLNSGIGVQLIETSKYVMSDLVTAGIKAGIPPVSTDDSGTGNSNVYYYNSTNSTNARVFCLSCHFPHGGPNYDLLRWDYSAVLGAGSQTGKTVAENQGCQLCHNRGGGGY